MAQSFFPFVSTGFGFVCAGATGVGCLNPISSRKTSSAKALMKRMHSISVAPDSINLTTLASGLAHEVHVTVNPCLKPDLKPTTALN
jgi:hypothetical protein